MVHGELFSETTKLTINQHHQANLLLQSPQQTPILATCNMRSNICTLILLLTVCLPARSQTPACPVKAGFVPLPNQIIYDGIPYMYYELKDTSKNSTTVRYSINDSWLIEVGGQINFNVGPNKVVQVASNGTCSDTFQSVIFVPGNMPVAKANVSAYIGHGNTYLQPYSLTGTSDKQLLISTKEEGNGFTYSNLIKMDRYGCIKKAVSSSEQTHWFDIASDGKGSNLLSFTSGYGGGAWWGGIMRLSDDLDPIWIRRFTMANYNLIPQRYANLPGGEFVSLSNYPNIGPTIPDQVLMRHKADGSVVWSKHLQFPGFSWSGSRGMVVIGDRLFIHIQTSIWLGDHWNGQDEIMAVDLNSGTILWQKGIGSPTNMFSTNELATQSGKLILTGSWNDPRDDPDAITTIIQMDPDGNIERNADLTNSGMYKISKGASFKFSDIDGQNFYLQLTLFNTDWFDYEWYYSATIKMHSDWTMEWKKIGYQKSLGPMAYGSVLEDGALATIGSGNGSGMIPNENTLKLLYQVYDKDFNQATNICQFMDPVMAVKPMVPIDVYDLPIIPYFDEAVVVSEGSQPMAPINITVRYRDEHCNDYLDSCNMIRITGPTEICNLQRQYTFTAWRNPACTQQVSWEIPQGARITSQSGNTITLAFDQAPSGYLKAYTPNTCVSVRDSVTIKLSDRAVGPLQLGNDTSICAGASFPLTARNGYVSYAWNTGAGTTGITISEPGKYWLNVMDACNTPYSDTIVVGIKTKERIDAGADQAICPDQSATFTAPDGYEQYQWTNEQSTVLASGRAFQTTYAGRYFLQAQVPGSCMAYDTVAVSLKPAPVLALGADTSICQGDALKLDAGAGYASYQWNTGATDERILVTAAGQYSVTVTGTNGCGSTASRNLLQVYPVPVVRLDRNPVLCEGTTRQLDAGPGYATYAWQDGSSGTSFSIDAPGKYWVTVKDARGCSGTDTTIVQRMVSLPADFMVPEDTICYNGSKWLAANGQYNQHAWSTGAVSTRIQVQQEGLYWLQVTDVNGCTGADSILLKGVQCQSGVHFPNAFSPNGDGRNDRFRPQVFSPLDRYEFTVYNRFGQVVFTSKDPTQGWDGTVAGAQQDGNAYTWTCVYRIVGQPLKREKGVVVLLR